MTDRYEVRDDQVATEAERLARLAEIRDPRTIEVLGRIGVEPGWHCLELGAGTGSIARWMAEQVGPDGRVMSTDVDLRFHVEATPNMIVRSHDVQTERLPAAHFDLVHARAVLQHLPEREAVIDKLVDALKPGGWMVLEDGIFMAFAVQPLPEPYKTIHDIICAGSTTEWRDGDFGVQLLGRLRDRGFTDIDAAGDTWAMRPGEAGGEWWFLAVERVGAMLVEASMVSQQQLDDALAQVRAPGFVMFSPLSMVVSGRKPA